MYDKLVAPLRELMIGEVREEISKHPVFKDKTVVQHKFGTEEVSRYGIIFTGISTTDIKLDFSNYIGPLSSYVGKAIAGDHPGYSVEWVKEDINHLTEYIEEDVSEQCDGFNKIIKVKNYPLTHKKDFDNTTVTVEVNGYQTRILQLNKDTGEIILKIAPLEADTVIVKYYYRRLVPKGVYQIEIINDDSFLISQLLHESNKELKTAKTTPSIYMAQYPFKFDFDIYHNNQELIRDKDYYFSPSTKRITFYQAYEDGEVQIKLKDDTLLYAGEHYFYTKYHKDYIIKALGTEKMFTINPYEFIVPNTISLTVNQVEEPFEHIQGNKIRFNRKLNTGDEIKLSFSYYDINKQDSVLCRDLFEITQIYQLPQQLTQLEVLRNQVIQSPNRDYKYEPNTGELFIYKVLKPNDIITVSYRHLGFVDKGPYKFKQNYVNTEVLPGVILAFGRRNQIGDKLMVMVNDKREVVADAYGGQWEVSMDLTLISDDPEQLGELTDYVHEIFKFNLRDRLLGEGIHITDISTGGDSEDEFHDSGLNRFTASMSLSLVTDWEAYKPIPYAIRQFEYSYEGDNLYLDDKEMVRTRTQGITMDESYIEVNGKFFEYLSTGNN